MYPIPAPAPNPRRETARSGRRPAPGGGGGGGGTTMTGATGVGSFLATTSLITLAATRGTIPNAGSPPSSRSIWPFVIACARRRSQSRRRHRPRPARPTRVGSGRPPQEPQGPQAPEQRWGRGRQPPASSRPAPWRAPRPSRPSTFPTHPSRARIFYIRRC